MGFKPRLEENTMTKIDVVSGFLGAGKTTLIKKLLKEALDGSKTVLIENEFGEIGIDGGFLKESGIEIKEMNSGCICCSLVGDFGTSLKEVISTYAPERILIEPSGVGKLSDVLKAVENVAGDLDVEINSAVAVVDASKCKMYMKNFGEFFSNQIEYAGTIILSRTDKVDQAKLNACVEMIREHNDKATIITTPLAQLDGKEVLGTIEGADKLEDMMKEMLEHIHDDHDEDECCGPDHDHEHHHHDHDHDDHDHECCCGHHHDDDEDEHEHHHHHDHDEDEHEHHHHHDHDDEDHDHEAEPADHAEGEADNTDGQNAAEDDHYDEHVWLSLKNAIVCTETLADAITELDSDNAKQYVTNAKTYTGKLEALDDDYQTMRDAATQTTILVGDRFPFLYLAEDYDIHYFAAYSGCSADVEASVHTVTYLAEKLQEYKLQAIYVVDNGTDSLANTIAESAEMQPKILHLSSMQSVTKDDIEKGCTYLSYMEENLQMLKQGLQAP